MIGKKYSHYKILEKLGEGGMGVVYKAEDTRLGRTVALKFPPPDRFSSDEDVERFNREARTVSALNDAHIATIYDLDESEGKKFIVFEYVPGGTLKAYAKELHDAGRNLSLEQVVDFGIQIVEGLIHAHENNVIHRDLKLDNILLTESGQVKITDFGLAKLKGSPELTRSGSTLGTASYMSPEQVRGEELDARSDLFSVGVILYQLVTGRLPFLGEHEMAIAYSIINNDPVPAKSLRPDLPDMMQEIINRCLEKEKEKRFQSARELSDALKSLHPVAASGKMKLGFGSRRTRWIMLGSIAVVLVAAVVMLRFAPPRSRALSDRTWIAVLPFENLSPDPENEYFSDGITDDIITQLSKIADLSVISRTSSMRYKNTDKSLREIGEELKVDAILEGSVRLADKQVRITGQLIDARTDEHLWANTYDRRIEDIFKIQSDVAEKIAHALEVKLSREEQSRIKAEPTQNMAAYDLYLRGREYYYHYREEDNNTAVSLFKKALKIDPEYALAYAGLADSYGQMVGRYGLDPTWLDSAYTAVKKAIELNDELAETQKALGLIYQIQGRYKEAREANKKALEYNPNYATAMANLGWIAVFTGQSDEAVHWFNNTIQLGVEGDLLVLQLNGLGMAYMIIDDTEMARHYFERALELRPFDGYSNVSRLWLNLLEERYDVVRNDITRMRMMASRDHPVFNFILGVIDIMENDLEDAGLHFEKAIESYEFQLSYYGGSVIDGQTWLAYVRWQQGDTATALELLDEASKTLKSKIEEGHESSYNYYLLAQGACIRGDRAEALQWLKEAYDRGFVFIRMVERDQLLADLRDDPSFKNMTSNFRARIVRMRERIDKNDW